MNSRLRAISRLCFLMIVLNILLMVKAFSQRSFALRHTAWNIKGDVVIIGNRVMQGASSTKNNDGTTMSNIDLDGSATTTTNSASADLNLPVGATIKWAGLYWAARSSNASRNTIKFKGGLDSYTTYTATQLDNGNTISDLVGENHYQAFVEVTSYIQLKGNTTYWAGDIKTTTGNDGTGFYGGWSLIVVYEDLTLSSYRNITVFDGYNAVYSSSVTINISGFLTPSTSGFTTKIGIIAWEGDLYNTGDKMRLNTNSSGYEVSNGSNPTTNFFNSTISSSASRNPSTTNNFGVDFDYITSNIALPTNATSTNIYCITSGDLYMPGALVFCTDINPQLLPVELSSFDARCQEDYAELNWSTASETNNDYFTIEKSTDGKIFLPKAIIKGAGNSNIARNYQWQDWEGYSAWNYYRLRQTDYNGKAEIAGKLEIQCRPPGINNGSPVTFFPNPFTDEIKIILPHDKEEITSISILNTEGKIVYTQNIVSASNKFSVTPTASLTSGLYWILLKRENEIICRNILQKL